MGMLQAVIPSANGLYRPVARPMVGVWGKVKARYGNGPYGTVQRLRC